MENKIELYVYKKLNNTLYFDVYEGFYGGRDNSKISYRLKDDYGCKYLMDSCNIEKVLKNNTVVLLNRDDRKASNIFADYYSQQIEKLQSEILKLQKKQKTEKVLWFRNGVGYFEEKQVDF